MRFVVVLLFLFNSLWADQLRNEIRGEYNAPISNMETKEINSNGINITCVILLVSMRVKLSRFTLQ